MKFSNEVRLETTLEKAWALLDDPERLAAAMPGASLSSVEGDVIRGQIAIRIGPLGLTYEGMAETVERDEAAKKLRLKVSADEQRGTGTANGVVSIQLMSEGKKTRVQVETELDLTGRPAQLGAGLVENVAGGLFQKFAQNLSMQFEEPSLDSDPATGKSELVLIDTKTIAVGVSVLALLTYFLWRFFRS